jgi:hypothetical protein
LRFVNEDHNVFVAKFGGSEQGFCGCALAIAAAGMLQLDLPYIGVHLSDALVKEISANQIDPIRYFAEGLGISMPLADKLDKLHRVDRISALKIAKMLRQGKI